MAVRSILLFLQSPHHICKTGLTACNACIATVLKLMFIKCCAAWAWRVGPREMAVIIIPGKECHHKVVVVPCAPRPVPAQHMRARPPSDMACRAALLDD